MYSNENNDEKANLNNHQQSKERANIIYSCAGPRLVPEEGIEESNLIIDHGGKTCLVCGEKIKFKELRCKKCNSLNCI